MIHILLCALLLPASAHAGPVTFKKSAAKTPADAVYKIRYTGWHISAPTGMLKRDKLADYKWVHRFVEKGRYEGQPYRRTYVEEVLIEDGSQEALAPCQFTGRPAVTVREGQNHGRPTVSARCGDQELEYVIFHRDQGAHRNYIVLRYRYSWSDRTPDREDDHELPIPGRPLGKMPGVEVFTSMQATVAPDDGGPP